MKERSILFSAPMVRAIRAGQKTQTRRSLRKQFSHDAEPAEVAATSPEGWQISGHSGLWWDDAVACIDDAIRCPYGQPGDRLWGRETWADLTATHGRRWEKWNAETRRYDSGVNPFVWYRADGDLPDIGNGDTNYASWRPSIFMPRWACRIFLEVAAVRVERLQDISEEDAIAEGVQSVGGGRYWLGSDGMTPRGSAVEAYRDLWESINGPDSWDDNPWVWVIEFRRITP